ncbi:MAG: Gfo/Idh/MocA family oxidoreductase [Limnochordaceae bacterium]|uniref:Gfo/Idh/MocA family oxidoreductase n=1 Tax=Carboxydichorda subterranea TaxID=3109565 RepID=A0ABZ1BV52_9FIRM|nr:Gfo/Idh/MocA family oxidoreductase [Limnochorda sp. L945t]MBE3597502.1 Gfo/Idh/MocA family oxidoreductase [Limnochordaceae bacterium]WRP16551.1 Gfo/Idh/MocA family oxidoreductase [Limnochorda sp. L945t]
MATTDLVRLGVVGTGAIARRAHLAAVKRSGAAEVAAVADVERQRAEAVAQEFGVPAAYGSLEEMLEARPEIEAVVVCTPNHLHARQALLALEAGKHVLVEKPMALTAEDADAMVAAARSSRRVLMVGFTHRFYAFNQEVHRLVREGAIGRILSFRVRFAHRGPYVAWPAESDWFLRADRAGGGALLDMGIHAVDLVRWLSGSEVGDVSAVLATVEPGGEVDRVAHLALRLQDGAIGTIEVGWSTHEGVMGYELYGTDGSIVVDYRTPVRLFVPGAAWQGLTGWLQPGLQAGDPFAEEHRYFARCVREGLTPEPDGVAGREALKVVLAAYASDRTGKRVAV